jgi:hypothetical protein
LSLPRDATIEEVAEVFGVSYRVGELTPPARRLTKGQMLLLLGADSTASVVRMIALGTFKRPSAALVEGHARLAGLQLSATDVQSVQRVFGSARLPANERAAVRSKTLRPQGGRSITTDEGGMCCCCPCCCATAVLNPVRPAIA